ncbi:carbon monoxide dehydrogenase [Pseudonocardia sp. EC080610-09]|uniref:xanthine dehydrogenase family protein molybdopterin-binding subunit n=1 Tax=unclassified Pseudonocardia TaxID=2619320 RepID=UPI00070625FE|nr:MULTISPECIES: xanthine dehydrogenase family protein molybdopterin-binding subunit [unclassified Pseudonocardia]ALL77534.1 carbon monoxide dehydrogenase [Pseudonocardia sp. EC080610-09]ALL80450.1 carbon monoxide dehydrogenase [Pseudonocardia sp. EC080619-01]
MPGSILGTSVRRVEDADLITGASTYVGNLLHGAGAPPALAHVAFVRSPLAHALVTGVDTTEAAAAPGVLAVYTAADLDLPAHHGLMVLNPDLPRPPLATGRVRFVGEAVAMVVADSRAAAVDATELVEIDYDPLPAVTDPEAALAEGAELQFPEQGSNLAAGERGPEPDPLDDAEVVVRARMVNQRVAAVPLEGNAILADPAPDPADGDFDLTVHVSTQMPHGFRAQLAGLLGLDTDRVRVIAPHVGGGFGAKAGVLAEHTATVVAARALGRPLAWVETRSENLVSMPHGRGQVGYYELGLTRDGRMTGLRTRVIGDAGAYAGFGGALPLRTTFLMATGVYDIPKLRYDAVAALTNTTPMGAFRGAGRPEAAAHLERLVDVAAAELDIDPVELRRRNFLAPDVFPYTTLTGATYDVGDYDLPLREALRLSGYDELRAEQARRREAGDPVRLGIGIAAYVEVTAGGGGGEYGSVTVHADGTATVSAGTSAHGQGHATSFSMLVSDRLGIPLEKITYVQSDTARVPRGAGTGGSRSLQLGGTAVAEAAHELHDRARKIAATLLEASTDDVEITEDGRFGVAGVPGGPSVGWPEVHAQAATTGEELHVGLDSEQAGATFPFGAHVSVVEVDTDTGRVTPKRHVAVDDCGRILNPLLVEGQQHGGMAQGIAQALYEEVLYDDEGQPLTSSLAAYTIPTAADMFDYETATTETPTPLNSLGAKGIGESATIGSTPAVQNAVVDALSDLGVRHIDLPCTPERVWRAVSAARAGAPQDAWREPPEVFGDLPVRGGGGDDEAAI